MPGTLGAEMELKPCPFCGGKAEIVSSSPCGIGPFSVCCARGNLCAIHPRTDFYEMEIMAVALWDRRPLNGA